MTDEKKTGLAVEYVQSGSGQYYVAAYPCDVEFAERVSKIVTGPSECFWIVPGTMEDQP